MNEIYLEEMCFFAYHGCRQEELTLGQRFLVTVMLQADFTKAIASDSINDAIDYVSVYQLVKETVEKERFHLIETLADRIAKNLLENFAIQAAEVLVAKTSPPMEGNLKQIAVKLKRTRDV